MSGLAVRPVGFSCLFIGNLKIGELKNIVM